MDHRPFQHASADKSPFQHAIAVVASALKQKYGDAVATIDLSVHEAIVRSTLDASLVGKDLVMAMVRELVSIVEGNIPKGNSDATSSPTGSTRITDLSSRPSMPAPQNARVNNPPNRSGMSTAPPGFVECKPVTGSTLQLSLPVGMTRILGIFIPTGGVEPVLWPVLILKVEDGIRQETVSVVLIRKATSDKGTFYSASVPLEVGPTSANDPLRKAWLTGCDNIEIRFGIDATVGIRTTIDGIAAQRRIHLISFDEGQQMDSTDPSSLLVLDDRGVNVGTVLRTWKSGADGALQTTPDMSRSLQSDDKVSYAVELVSGGSTPVSVCISSNAPYLCVG
jgi:hypothetical protein